MSAGELREAKAENEYLRSRNLQLSAAIDTLSEQIASLQAQLAEHEGAGDDPQILDAEQGDTETPSID